MKGLAKQGRGKVTVIIKASDVIIEVE